MNMGIFDWIFRMKSKDSVEMEESKEYKKNVINQKTNKTATNNVVSDPLIQTLKDKHNDWEVRKNAAFAIGKKGDKKAVGPLIQVLKDEFKDITTSSSSIPSTVPTYVAEALGKIGAPSVKPLIEALNHHPPKDEYYYFREYIVKALRKIEDERAIEPLNQAMKNENEEFVRATAKEALENIRWRKEENKTRDIQQRASEAYKETIANMAIEPLIHALKDEKLNVRMDAARTLGEKGDTRAVEPLIQALKDDDGAVVEALGEIGDTRAVEPLIQALKNSNDLLYRTWVIMALGKIGDARAAPFLCQVLLNDEDVFIKQSVYYALIKFGEPALIHLSQVAKQAKEEENWEVAGWVVRAIGDIHKGFEKGV